MKRLESGEPCIDQCVIGKTTVTYNPDDAKFYVEYNGHTAVFEEYRNAIGFAKRKA